jgi:hypothetical protein
MEFYIKELEELSNGLGEYTNMNTITEKIKLKGDNLLSKIEQIEVETKNIINSKLSYTLAIAYYNYCSWYRRGDERKEILEKSISLLNQSIFLSPQNIESKAKLGHMLIDYKIIRDLSKGIKLLEELRDNNELPVYLNSTLAEAKRKIGNIENNNFNLCSFQDPSPAVFREERKRFRALIRKYKKENRIELLEQVLNDYYGLAVLATFCYGEHDCNSGVSGRMYDEAIKIVNKVCNKINFLYLDYGIIENSSFISNNDWKIFIKVFGKVDKQLTSNILEEKNNG